MFKNGIQLCKSEPFLGSSYCAVASLFLLHHLHDNKVLSKKQTKKLVSWALQQQDMGFHGRTNKPDDTCYAFWIGGTLAVSL